MENVKKSDYVLRDSIMKMLSDDEISRVSTAETAARLSDGEEYLDMENFERGVLTAKSTTTPMGRILSKGSVRDQTWKAILAKLASASATK